MSTNFFYFSNIKWIDSSYGKVAYDLFKGDLYYLKDKKIISLKDGNPITKLSIGDYFEKDIYPQELSKDESPFIDNSYYMAVECDFAIMSCREYAYLINSFGKFNMIDIILYLNYEQVQDIQKIDELLNNIQARLINLRIVSYQKEETTEIFIQKINSLKIKFNKLINVIILYNYENSIKSDVYSYIKYSPSDKIYYSKQYENITKIFAINYETFYTAKFYNLFYFNKIEINKFGKVGYLVDYDNMMPMDMNSKEIRQLYYEQFTISRVTKDRIQVCKSCPFRYCCFDNRIPIKNFDNEYYIEDVNSCGVA